MAMKRCPVCGERYSDTYRYCPFCEEEDLDREEEVRRFLSLNHLREALETGDILEAPVQRCGVDHTLLLNLGGVQGRIPREEAVAPAISGADRDIAVLSRVGKPTCFTVTALESDGKGAPLALLSRRAAQEQAIAWLLEHGPVGSVLPARVTHLEKFGAFVDLGCGVTSLVPLENISVSRIPHPAARFRVGQDILTAVTDVDPAACRFYLSHKELLGTWLENAAAFSPGTAVPGVVRGVRDYGIFIELAPNLSGLADWRSGVELGDAVSVYIKSIRPDCRKIKLQIIQDLGPAPEPEDLRYFITDGTVEGWSY